VVDDHHAAALGIVRGGRDVCLDVIVAVTGDDDRLSAEGIAHSGIISCARTGVRPPRGQRSDLIGAIGSRSSRRTLFRVGSTIGCEDEHPNGHPEYAICAFVVTCLHDA
jgi:hypothetical protein